MPGRSGDIGSEDGSQPPLNPRFGHKYRPQYRDFGLSL